MTDKLSKAALELVRDRMEKPENWSDCGICGEYGYALDFLELDEGEYHDSALRSHFPDWPEFSGLVPFPVPDGRGKLFVRDAYMDGKKYDMWDRDRSEYARNRWKLLEWLIARAEYQGQ